MHAAWDGEESFTRAEWCACAKEIASTGGVREGDRETECVSLCECVVINLRYKRTETIAKREEKVARNSGVCGMCGEQGLAQRRTFRGATRAFI